MRIIKSLSTGEMISDFLNVWDSEHMPDDQLRVLVSDLCNQCNTIAQSASGLTGLPM